MKVREFINRLSGHDGELEIGFAIEEGELEVLSVYSNEHRDGPIEAKRPTKVWVDLG